MKRLPQGHYSKEFREEAVKLVKEGGFSLGDVCSRLSVPKSTLEAWIRAAVKGTLGEIGKGQRPLTDLELELAKIKKELAQVPFAKTWRLPEAAWSGFGWSQHS